MGSGVSSASCPSGAEPEAFGGVEAGVVEGGAEGLVFRFGFRFVGGDGWGCRERERVVERELLEDEEPFDRAAAVGLAHPAVAAEQVADLTVDAAFQW